MELEPIADFELRYYITIIQRANQIAATTELDELLEQLLELIIEVTQAQAGTIYLYEPASDELVFKVVQGDEASKRFLGKRISVSEGVIGRALLLGEPLYISDVQSDPTWNRQLGGESKLAVSTMFCVPLLLRKQPIGAIQVFNLPKHTVLENSSTKSLLDLLSGRLVTEIEKNRLLYEAQQREQRQSALIDIMTSLTTTLDRDSLLNNIMDYAASLLNIEATSIWLKDDITNELVLYAATGEKRDALREVRINANDGIIGSVVASGVPVLIENVHEDERFYKQIDQQTGFETRSMICMPLRSPKIQLSVDRGELQEAIIGGAQAINKRDGRPFTEEDMRLFEALSGQAATVLRLSKLYTETSGLFFGIIKAISNAIDLRDTYTRGHSQRVAEFSVAIAHQLGLSPEEIYYVRIGGILHDVGKIGVSDQVLKKPSRLTDQEMDEMKRHPTYGVRMFEDSDLRYLLRYVMPALEQHHERLDGSGYPRGLKASEISLIGRIVAVADAFDAMTSDRPYRLGMTAEHAFANLDQSVGSEYDGNCIAALKEAYQNGMIVTQQERIDR